MAAFSSHMCLIVESLCMKTQFKVTILTDKNSYMGAPDVCVCHWSLSPSQVLPRQPCTLLMLLLGESKQLHVATLENSHVML